MLFPSRIKALILFTLSFSPNLPSTILYQINKNILNDYTVIATFRANATLFNVSKTAFSSISKYSSILTSEKMNDIYIIVYVFLIQCFQ